MRSLGATLLVLISAAATARAQAPPEIRLVTGPAVQGGIFGDDDPASTMGAGFAVGVQVRGQRQRRTGLSFELTAQPVAIGNPHFDESLRAVYVLGGAEIGRAFYVRPAFGVGLRLWSGTRAASASSLVPAAGIAVGGRGLGTRRIGIEALVRCAGEPGALGWMGAGVVTIPLN